MKHTRLALMALAAVATLHALPANARDTKLMLPLEDVLNMPEAKEKLDGKVRFFLAGQKTPKVLEVRSTEVSNRKTNGVGKSDEEACRWAALGALVAFQDKARELGVNGVVDLVSYYKKDEVQDSANYECHAGSVVVGVALKGKLARIAN
ncbi:MAG: excinuclease ATPase subunit [Cupriavidus sp.]|nr:excinuclease ATPase subunit [Cupriavidus sp.]